jgi:hypothetical protein
MKRVGQRYVQCVNRTYRRTGGWFERRFRSSLIEADRYLLACQRYIELNAVRTAMVVRRSWKGSPGRPRKKQVSEEQQPLPL